MNSPIFTRVTKSIRNRGFIGAHGSIGTRVTKHIKTICACAIALFSVTANAGWTVDFSRRQDQMAKPKQLEADIPNPAKAEEKNIFERVFNTVVPAQEIVIINTEQGFIPSVVRVKEGAQYRIVVVNVNEKARNVSFVLDSFSEHHATFYGKAKSFYISPKKEGVYTFISPETSAQGRIVVHSTTGEASMPVPPAAVFAPADTASETRVPAAE